ncbi:MAG TPA: PIG-L family deacetylase, partial [Candidatus Eisenbacteria bacterium]
MKPSVNRKPTSPSRMARWAHAAAILMVVSLTCLATPARADDPAPRPPMNAAEIDVALKRLSVVGTALYVAAHPDDENTAVLTWLENVAGVRAAYLSMTRGDGGQNLIGNEKGDLLGLVRTQELLAARRIDGAEQFFTRALDFGFSKNPDETLAFWGRDSVLADVVRTIRYVKPDIIINRFPTTGEGGHGHHTASAILSLAAFEAAGDPGRYPEQVARYGTWKPKRAFLNWFTGARAPDAEVAKTLVTVDVGDYAPLLGKSSNELAADSRSMHKSQGFGSAERRGHQVNYFKVVAGDSLTKGLFDGIDLTWKRVPGGEKLGTEFEAIRTAYDPRNPSASLPALLRADAALATLRQGKGAAAWSDLLERKAADLHEVIRSCAGLWIEAIATDASFAGGDSLKVNFMAVNRSPVPMTVTRAQLLVGPERAVLATVAVDKAMDDNTPVTAVLNGVVPSSADWTWTQPWWLREPHGKGALAVPDTRLFDVNDTPPLAVAGMD